MIECLVNIDSGSRNPEGVNAVAESVGRSLEELGFSLDRHPLASLGDQVEAGIAGRAGPRLLILGHTDTVWPEGTTATWQFKRRRDRILGPGVGDMKSCLVMAVFALRELECRGLLDEFRSVRFLLVPDEELGSVSSRKWIENAALESDVCLTLEAGDPGGGVVVARGAVGAVYVEASGISAHCSSADAGASAVSALAGLVPTLEALTDLEAGAQVSVGVFRGGTARQVVPDAAEIEVDLRAPDQASADALLGRVSDAVAQHARPPIGMSLRGGITRPAFPRSRQTEQLLELVRQAASALNAPIREVVEPGGSDASFAAALGVPTLDGLGPFCHHSCSRNESVELSSLVTRGAVFASLVASLPEWYAKQSDSA